MAIFFCLGLFVVSATPHLSLSDSISLSLSLKKESSLLSACVHVTSCCVASECIPGIPLIPMMQDSVPPIALYGAWPTYETDSKTSFIEPIPWLCGKSDITYILLEDWYHRNLALGAAWAARMSCLSGSSLWNQRCRNP